MSPLKKLGHHGARLIWLLLGTLALVLGAIGAIVPLLPTTPFVLLAAFAYAKSSDRLHQWLLAHRVFGALIDDWHRYGAIRKNARIASILSMLAVIAISLLLRVPTHALLIQIVVLGASAVFILTRPLPPARPRDNNHDRRI